MPVVGVAVVLQQILLVAQVVLVEAVVVVAQ
jgi:hypothetical protein